LFAININNIFVLQEEMLAVKLFYLGYEKYYVIIGTIYIVLVNEVLEENLKLSFIMIYAVTF
jgi:hypothetical protein